jgi:hypothetical protein
MTVTELIAALQKLDPEAIVAVWDPYHDEPTEHGIKVEVDGAYTGPGYVLIRD